MPRSTWLADVLSDAYRGIKGVRLEVYPGWETRGDPRAQHAGVMGHHTGGGRYDPLLAYMATNSSIAPLCNVASSADGRRVTVVASGKANHAGRGHLSWTGTDRGNWYTVGWEAQNDGSQPWDPWHLEVQAVGHRAILNHLNAGRDRLVDHRTYAPKRKVDRHSIDLDWWRNKVDNLVKPQPPEPDAPQKEDTMDVKYGDQGPDVYKLQMLLNDLANATVGVPGPEGDEYRPLEGGGNPAPNGGTFLRGTAVFDDKTRDFVAHLIPRAGTVLNRNLYWTDVFRVPGSLYADFADAVAELERQGRRGR